MARCAEPPRQAAVRQICAQPRWQVPIIYSEPSNVMPGTWPTTQAKNSPRLNSQFIVFICTGDIHSRIEEAGRPEPELRPPKRPDLSATSEDDCTSDNEHSTEP